VNVFDKARGLFAGATGRAKRAPKLSPLTVEHDHIDEYVLDDLARDSKRFTAALERPYELDHDGTPEEYGGSFDLNRDLFLAHHTMHNEVAVKDAGEVKPSAELSRQVVGEYVKTEDFLKAHACTRGDEIGSAAAMSAAQAELAKALQEADLKEHAERAEEMRDQEQALDGLDQLLDQLREQARDAVANGQDVPQDVADAVKDATAQRGQAREKLGDLIDQQAQAMPQMRAQAVKVVERASEAAKDAAQVWASLPGNEPGQPLRIAPDDALELAARWRESQQMKDVARLIGRMKRDFKAKAAKKITGGHEERVGIELGNDLSRVVASEIANLAHPVMRLKFFKDYSQRSLMQHQMIGEELAGLGPMLVLLDKSSSMMNPRINDRYTHGRDRFATAVALALYALAQRSRRDYGLRMFNARLMGEWFFTKNQTPDLAAITEIASTSPSGGTDTTLAFQWAHAALTNVAAFKRADIVLITDGEDKFNAEDEQLRDTLRAMGVRVFGVTLEIGQTGYTAQMCDEQVSVFDLAGASQSTDQLVAAVA
jgi:uncharacterized protein with von Willebrand factor type A (vWA) domain